jgi:hypothetical protein
MELSQTWTGLPLKIEESALQEWWKCNLKASWLVKNSLKWCTFLQTLKVQFQKNKYLPRIGPSGLQNRFDLDDFAHVWHKTCVEVHVQATNINNIYIYVWPLFSLWSLMPCPWKMEWMKENTVDIMVASGGMNLYWDLWRD